jgi:hypothetical protein
MDTEHPSQTAAHGLVLRDFWVEHPEASRITTFFAGVGLDVPVRYSSSPRLKATLQTPRGLIRIS